MAAAAVAGQRCSDHACLTMPSSETRRVPTAANTGVCSVGEPSTFTRFVGRSGVSRPSSRCWRARGARVMHSVVFAGYSAPALRARIDAGEGRDVVGHLAAAGGDRRSGHRPLQQPLVIHLKQYERIRAFLPESRALPARVRRADLDRARMGCPLPSDERRQPCVRPVLGQSLAAGRACREATIQSLPRRRSCREGAVAVNLVQPMVLAGRRFGAGWQPS